MYSQIRKFRDTSSVVIESINTDVRAKAAYVSTKVEGALGVKVKKKSGRRKETCPEALSSIDFEISCNDRPRCDFKFHGKGECYFITLKFHNSISSSSQGFTECLKNIHDLFNFH